jgi:hypothetical protein
MALGNMIFIREYILCAHLKNCLNLDPPAEACGGQVWGDVNDLFDEQPIHLTAEDAEAQISDVGC